MKKVLLTSLSCMLVFFTISCEKEKKQCENNLNVFEFENCQCPIGSYNITTAEDFNSCKILDSNEWALTIQDTCFAYKKVVYLNYDTATQMTPIIVDFYNTIGYSKDNISMRLIDGPAQHSLLADYKLITQTNGIDSVYIDFRPARTNNSFCKETNEGFFITGVLENGVPKYFMMNHGQPGERFNYVVVSSTPITVSK